MTTGNTAAKYRLRDFPTVFWVANIMELFERGAYYGMNSILAIYLSNEVVKGGLGFSEQAVGFLQGMIYALVYIIPIIGGALAEKYGYRRMLLISFALLGSGYFLTGQVNTYGAVFAALLVLATGAGLFKPIISGTIARTTTEATSGLGFGVYYWMINLGAFLAPLVVSYIKGFSWSYVFIASSLYCAAMLILTATAFKDPPGVGSGKTLRQVFRGAAEVLADSRFMLMIVLYSGFWILYFQNFGSVLWFLRDFIDPGPVNEIFASLGIPLKFDAEFVTIINAGTIIFLQIVISKLVEKRKPLPTMLFGMAVGISGFLILSFTTNVWIFILSLVVFSIGEMTAHPKYFSYIGMAAPADKKAVYMGYASLYGVIGSLIGSNLGGALYERVMKPVIGTEGMFATSQSFWLLFVGIGIFAVGGLLVYNKMFVEDTPKNNRRARLVMTGIYGLLIVIGGYFLATSGVGEEINYKIIMQATIMLLIGSGGLYITLRKRE